MQLRVPHCGYRFRWSSLWSHESCEGCAKMGGSLGGVDACGRGHWSLRWSSLWGYEPCEGRAEMGRWRHADAATGALGGAPYGSTNRVRGVP